MVTVIQNFICTKPERLEYLQEDIVGIGSYFKDYDFIVNYNTDTNLSEVRKCYEDNVNKLTFYNDLTRDWGKTTLELIKQAKTDYVFIMPEDFICVHDHPEYFKKSFNEAISLGAEYYLMHRIHKYANTNTYRVYNVNEYSLTCDWIAYPGTTISSVAIYKKEFIINLLEYYIDNPGRFNNKFPITIPNNFEWFYHTSERPDRISNALGKSNFICGLPKEPIILHHEPTGDLKQR